ncbi:Pre-mRNA-splicing factor cef1 [Ascosphaera pollenicola]|nr:Pre-mRNA-splicing factor cef1 [Ascosphaera pollenicola]
MPVVKGGVWTNVEDETVKAAVSKYGLNQWARVSSLLNSKTAKQCKARWAEWLDPSIRKTEWSREEDEKLLHLAKLMPTQWRTIASIVGRTATQCLERYQKLLDEAEAKESSELGIAGPGGEAAAPTADDVRRLRPGELDPDPESKPAKPDAIDLDEYQKEMLSEVRARVANTRGKKAKRKARERQLEESHRLALLQKRRELKAAGINVKVTTVKKGQMDYNADIPFEKAPAPGFYDTAEEIERNEKQRAAFDPRKAQANKRKADEEEQDNRKKKKDDKSGGTFTAAMKAGHLQKIREAEQSSKRRPLNLPAPQVSEAEIEEIVKMGMAGERAIQMAGEDNEDTRGLVGKYSTVIGNQPIRTPRVAQEEDRIANEIKNIRALTETKSSLLGGENTPLHEGRGSTGFDGIAPTKQTVATPNPMATPFRQAGAGMGQTPAPGAVGGATPLQMPRDTFALNARGADMVGATPKDIRNRENLLRKTLRSQLNALPKPKEVEFELEEMPSESPEPQITREALEQDAAERDRIKAEHTRKAQEANFKRQTQVIQRDLPRPTTLDCTALMRRSEEVSDPIESLIAREAAILIAHDVRKRTKGAKVEGTVPEKGKIGDAYLQKAREALAQETAALYPQETWQNQFEDSWSAIHSSEKSLPGLSLYDDEDEKLEEQQMIASFDIVQSSLLETAEQGNKLEKKIALHNGGYHHRAKLLRNKILEAHDTLEKNKLNVEAFRILLIGEDAGLSRRLEALREEVQFVTRREREAQGEYKQLRDEMEALDLTAAAR